MKTLKSTDKKIERTSGTSLQGYLNTEPTYTQLVEVLGEPTYSDLFQSHGKVNIEWVVEYKGEVYTIYDYKLDYDLKEEHHDQYAWHVGGHSDPNSTEGIGNLLSGESFNSVKGFINEIEAKLSVKDLLK